jgi:cytochrome P450 family 9
MRQMFEFMRSVGQQAAVSLKDEIRKSGETEYEFKDLSKKITVDVIATCAFGIEVNSFENPKNDFNQIAHELLNFGSFLTSLKFVGLFMAPKLMKFFKVKLFASKITEFFREIVSETMKTREEKGIVRKDMIHLLMEAKKGQLTHEKEKEEKIIDGFATVEESAVGQSEVKRKWEDDDLTAQW